MVKYKMNITTNKKKINKKMNITINNLYKSRRCKIIATICAFFLYFLNNYK